MTGYIAYTSRARQQLLDAKRGSKQWWKISRELLSQRAKVHSIPALQATGGKWLYEPAGKAELLATTFSDKNVLPAPVTNYYSGLEVYPHRQKDPRQLTLFDVTSILANLDARSGAGPDLHPSKNT